MSDRKYPATVVGLYNTRSGKQQRSAVISAEKLTQIQALFEAAGSNCKLVIRSTRPETKEAKGDKFPDAFLEIMTEEELAAEKEAAQAAGGL